MQAILLHQQKLVAALLTITAVYRLKDTMIQLLMACMPLIKFLKIFMHVTFVTGFEKIRLPRTRQQGTLFHRLPPSHPVGVL